MYNEIIQFIQTVGFPIVMCGSMAWYVKYITDRNHDDIDKINMQHREEMKQVTEAITNNTLAVQRLTDLLSKEVE